MSSYYGELFDVSANRHGGNSESEKAFEKVKDALPAMRYETLHWIQEQGDHGATAQEYADYLGVPINRISGRFSELKRDGRIQKIGTRNNGGVFQMVTMLKISEAEA